MSNVYPADFRKYSEMLGKIVTPHTPLEIKPIGIDHESYCWKVVYPNFAAFVGMIKLTAREIVEMARLSDERIYAMLQDKLRLVIRQ